MSESFSGEECGKLGTRKRRNFFMVENALVDDWMERIGPEAFAAYCILERYADREGKCFPTITTLSNKMGKSKWTILRILDRLQEAGLIAIEPTTRPDGGQGPNNYWLLPLPANQDNKPDDPSPSSHSTYSTPPGSMDATPPGSMDATPPVAWVLPQEQYPYEQNPLSLLPCVNKDHTLSRERESRAREKKSDGETFHIQSSPEPHPTPPSRNGLDSPCHSVQPQPEPAPRVPRPGTASRAWEVPGPGTAPRGREVPGPGASPVGTGTASRGRDRQPATPPPPEQGTRIPPGFHPLPEMILEAEAYHAGLNIEREMDSFRDYYASLPNPRGLRVDWQAVWRCWLRKSIQAVQGSRPRHGFEGPGQRHPAGRRKDNRTLQQMAEDNVRLLNRIEAKGGLLV